MKQKYRIRVGRIVVPVVAAIIAAAAWGMLMSLTDLFIIYYGVGAYRAAVSLAKYLFFILIGVSVGVSIYEVKRYRNFLLQDARIRSDIEARQEQEVLEQKKKESYLAASGKLSENTMRDEISGAISGSWYFLEEKLTPLIEQSKRMDEYQSRLADLLRKNGADKLDDAEDVLDRVEQEMLRNMRKVINYIEIGVPDQKDSVARIRDAAGECHDKNARLLSDTSAFLVALTDYLNSQGDSSDTVLEALDSYKSILIKSTSGKN